MQIELGKFVGIQYHLTGFEAPENPETEPEIEEIEKTSPERPFTFIFGVGQLLQDFEKNIAGKEVGYKFRPEFIIDQGYMNNTYRIPSKEFKDFQAFQRREVARLAKEMVDIVHEYGKEAMMFREITGLAWNLLWMNLHLSDWML